MKNKEEIQEKIRNCEIVRYKLMPSGSNFTEIEFEMMVMIRTLKWVMEE